MKVFFKLRNLTIPHRSVIRDAGDERNPRRVVASVNHATDANFVCFDLHISSVDFCAFSDLQ
jgi:hypothetical protein